MAIANHIINIVKNKPGMRMKLLTQCGRTPTADVAADVQRSFGIKDEKALNALITVARIVAKQTPATGSFIGHNPESKATGNVLRTWVDQTGKKDQILKLLTRCVSLDLKYSRSYIESLINQLLNDGYQINIGRLYGDLVHWDDTSKLARIKLITGFSRLNDLVE